MSYNDIIHFTSMIVSLCSLPFFFKGGNKSLWWAYTLLVVSDALTLPLHFFLQEWWWFALDAFFITFFYLRIKSLEKDLE